MRRIWLAALLIWTGSALADVSLNTKLQLQADMERHIQGVMINGVYPHIDLTTGAQQTLFPAAGHPMILKMSQGELFVLCSELRDESGQSHNVDFYMAKSGASYKVIRTEVSNRAPLKALMERGLVAKVN